MSNVIEIEKLIGKTLTSIRGEVADDEIVFTTTEGDKFRWYHQQDCCESVAIEDIIGNLDDLIDSPIVMAEYVTKDNDEAPEEGMWTFYKFATVKGYVTIRWYGCSNGYYSIAVSFQIIPKEK